MALLTAALQISPDSGLLADSIAALKLFALTCVMAWAGLSITRKVSTSDTFDLLGNLFLASFALRLVSSLLLLRVVPLLVYNHPYLSFGFINDDAILFDMLAILGQHEIQNGRSPFQAYATGQTGAVAYVFLMSLTYVLVGHELLGIQIVNSFFGSLVPVFGFLIAQQILPYAQARLSGIFMALYPEQILYSGSHQKDISIVCAFVVGLWLVISLFKQTSNSQRAWYIGLLIMMTAYLSLARFYYAVLLGAALVLMLGFDNIRRMSIKQLVQGVVLVTVMMSMMLFLIAFLLPRGIQSFLNPIATVMGFYERFVGGNNREGSLYVLFRFPFNVIFFPLVILGVLLNPFILWPFISPNPIYWILLPTIITWYVILPFIVYGFATTHQAGTKRMLFLVVSGAMLILIITGSGLTTAGRSKIPLQPFAIMYAVVGFQAYKEGKIWMRWLSGTYAACLTTIIVLYSILKLSIPTNVLILAVLPNLAVVSIIALALWQRNRALLQTESTSVAPDHD